MHTVIPDKRHAGRFQILKCGKYQGSIIPTSDGKYESFYMVEDIPNVRVISVSVTDPSMVECYRQTLRLSKRIQDALVDH